MIFNFPKYYTTNNLCSISGHTWIYEELFYNLPVRLVLN